MPAAKLRNNSASVAELDEKDCAILAELQTQGDLPNVELARRLGLSPAATLRRVQRLRAEGVIQDIRAVISTAQAGLPIEAFVLVTLSAHGARAEADFARAILTMPHVLRADSITGTEDVLLHVAAASPGELHRLLIAIKHAGAAHVTTLLRLQTVKPPVPVPVRPTK